MCLPFDTCCCCISLEVGAQIISIISTFLSALVMLVYGSAVALVKLKETKMMFYATMAVIAGCQVLFGCLLIYGVFRRQPKCVWPWLVSTWLQSVALMALSVVGSAVLVYSGQFQIDVDTNAVLFSYIIYSGLLFYFASVVNSRRLEMIEEVYTYTAKRLMRPTATAWKYV